MLLSPDHNEEMIGVAARKTKTSSGVTESSATAKILFLSTAKGTGFVTAGIPNRNVKEACTACGCIDTLAGLTPL